MKNLNFLLVMPRVVAIVGEGYNFPLGITYVSSSMKKAGLNVFTLNLNHIDGDIDEIITKEIEKNKIDVAMIGGVSVQYSSIKRIVDSIHYNSPQVKIVIGGGIITAEPQTAMIALEYADFGVIGEGEITSVELCNALCNGTVEYSNIEGIIYTDNGNWTQTKPRGEIMDLNSLPFPDYDGFGLDHYLELPPMSISNVTVNRSFFVIGSRSCPYQCTFCFHSTGKKYRQRSIDNLIKEVEYLSNEHNVKHIMFSDELFARKIERVKIIEDTAKKFNITWSAFFRVDDVNDELIEILKKGKCTSMSLGLESACNKILKSMRKKITIEQIDSALQLIYSAGIHIAGAFIFGDIEETIETAEETLKYWENHKEYGIALAFIITCPGTYIYKYACQNGIIKDPVKFLKDGCPQINVSKLSDDEFSYIAEKMFNLEQGEELFPIESELLSFNTGRMTIKGKCIKCGYENVWENVRLLSGADSTTCSKCGQKHYPPFPLELQNNIINNISKRNEQCSSPRIGLWGINRTTFKFFRNSDNFKEEKYIFIDNALSKQKLKIHNRKVNSPDVLLTDEIEMVVFFYPNFYAVIAEEIKRKYPKVKHFVNVYELLLKN